MRMLRVCDWCGRLVLALVRPCFLLLVGAVRWWGEEAAVGKYRTYSTCTSNGWSMHAPEAPRSIPRSNSNTPFQQFHTISFGRAKMALSTTS